METKLPVLKTNDIVTPEVVEEKHSDADTATVFFKKYYPMVREGTKDMSARQLRRVILCAVGQPWEASEVKPANEAEENLVYIMRQMMVCSLTMQEEFNRLLVEKAKTEEGAKNG